MLTLYKDRGRLSSFAPSSGGEFLTSVSLEGIIMGEGCTRSVCIKGIGDTRANELETTAG
jgi:hypothetical protein